LFFKKLKFNIIYTLSRATPFFLLQVIAKNVASTKRMVTDLCNLLKLKIKDISIGEKIEIFIGTIHMQQEPLLSFMYELIAGIPISEFALATMNFMRNYDSLLQNEPRTIIINDTGSLSFYFLPFILTVSASNKVPLISE
jgi:hypothetical protein